MKKLVLTLVVAALGVPSFAGFGGAINLYNTGFDGVNTYGDGVVDPHWMVSPFGASPDGSTYTLGDTVANWSAGWLANSSDSKWIGTTATTTATGTPGLYSYSQLFSLNNLDPLTATISGRWTGDDDLIDILLNGVSLGTDGNNGGVIDSAWGQWYNFDIASGTTAFTGGLNKITFVVRNDDNFLEGARVELSGRAFPASNQPVPEPFTMGLMGLGAAGALRRRKKSQI